MISNGESWQLLPLLVQAAAMHVSKSSGTSVGSWRRLPSSRHSARRREDGKLMTPCALFPCSAVPHGRRCHSDDQQAGSQVRESQDAAMQPGAALLNRAGVATAASQPACMREGLRVGWR